VIEVVNPGKEFVGSEDLEFLEAFATDVAFAHEKVLVYERLRAKVTSLRQTCRVAGGVLAALGVVMVVWAVLGHLAVALPLRELAARPAFWMALLPLVAGAVLIAVAQRAGAAASAR
jgi:hypothetical protein